MPRFSSLLASAIVRRPRTVLVFTILLTLAALVPASRFRVETDLAALLPEGAPAAEDYRLFLRTFGGFEKVFVIVRSPQTGLEDPEPLTTAAEQLGEILSRSPEVAEARSGLTAEDERFFLTYVAPRMPLLVHGDGWREDLARRLEPAAIHDRVAQMRQALRGPAGSVVATFFTADPLGLSEGLLDAASTALPMDPLTGSFVSPRGDAALVILTPARAEIDPAGGKALLAELDRAYMKVRGSSSIPLDFKAVGGPIYAAQDETLLRGDLSRTATASALGVAVLLLLGFGGAFIPLTILESVVAGLVWTVAITALWQGRITVVGVGFAAALLGMGVEYGIHGGARFRQLRLAGQDAATALAGTFRDPGPGIVSSALTTAAGLGALCLAHFRPLRELGQVLTVGVLVTLVTTVGIGAAVLVGFPRRSEATSGGPRLWRRFGQPALESTTGFAARRPWTVVGMAVLLTAVSGWGVSRLSFSTDLRSLRPADHPSTEAERVLVDTFAVGLDTFTVVAPGRTLGEALDKAAAARPVLEAGLGKTAQITSPADWLIQGRRLERRLAELRALPLERAADDFGRELVAAGFKLAPFEPALAAMRAAGRGEDPGLPPARSGRGGCPSWCMKALGASRRPFTCAFPWAPKGTPRRWPGNFTRFPGSRPGLDPPGGGGAAGVGAGRPRPVERRGAGAGGPGGARLHELADRRLAALRPASRPRVPVDVRPLGSLRRAGGPARHLDPAGAFRHGDRPGGPRGPWRADAPGRGNSRYY